MILVRNTEWAASFFADVGQYAYMHPETIEKYMRPVRTHDNPDAPAPPSLLVTRRSAFSLRL